MRGFPTAASKTSRWSHGWHGEFVANLGDGDGCCIQSQMKRLANTGIFASNHEYGSKVICPLQKLDDGAPHFPNILDETMLAEYRFPLSGWCLEFGWLLNSLQQLRIGKPFPPRWWLQAKELCWSEEHREHGEHRTEEQMGSSQHRSRVGARQEPAWVSMTKGRFKLQTTWAKDPPLQGSECSELWKCLGLAVECCCVVDLCCRCLMWCRQFLARMKTHMFKKIRKQIARALSLRRYPWCPNGIHGAQIGCDSAWWLAMDSVYDHCLLED